MKLSILERIILSQLLPAQGTFLTLKLLRVLKEDLSFTEEENKILEFEQDGETLHWKEPGVEREIEIGDTMNQIIVEALKELDKNAELTDQHFSLYEKFIKE